MTAVHFNLNRPVHLARRDTYFEKMVEMLFVPVEEADTAERIRYFESILTMLKTAVTHASFAAKATTASDKDKDFFKYLVLVEDNVQSMLAMLEHQAHLEATESFLCHFLNTPPEQCFLPAMHYRRRADDLLEGLCHQVRLAHTPFRILQQENQEQLTSGERERFKKAYNSYKQDLEEQKLSKDAEPVTSPE